MKYFTKLLFTISAVFTGTIYAQTLVGTTTTKRVAVLEESTGNYCTYCPDGHKRADQIDATHGNQVITLKLQGGSYAGTDPIFGGSLATDHGNIVQNQFPTSTGWPYGFVNRVYLDRNRSQWATDVAAIVGQDSPVNVGIEATIDATTKEMIVNVEYYYTADEANPTNYLHIGYYQDNIAAFQFDPGFYQENFYLAEDEVYKFNHCFRANITPISSSGTWGEEITSTTTGSTNFISKTITLPNSFNNFNVEAGGIKVFAFISKTDKGEIISGAKATPVVSNYPTAINAKLLYAGPGADDFCVGSDWTAKPMIIISNSGGTNLTNAQISYGINGGNQSDSWSGGTLKPSEKVGVYLNETPLFTYNTTNTFDAEITDVNSTTDDDVSDNTKSATFSGTTRSKTATIVRVEAKVDEWGPDESGWRLRNSNGDIVFEVNVGDMVEGVNIEKITLTEDVTDCYQFEIFDTYGDGWGSNMYFRIYNDEDNSTLTTANPSTGQMSKRTTKALEITTPLNVNDISKTNLISIFPNPTNGNSNLELNLVENSNVKVDVLNTLGQVVFTKTLTNVSGNQTINIDSQNFESGLYLVNIKVGDLTTTKKLTVTK